MTFIFQKYSSNYVVYEVVARKVIYDYANSSKN